MLLTTHVNVAVTHIDDLQLPQVLHTVQSAVAAGQEALQVLMETQILQPGGQRAAAVTSKSFHLKENIFSITAGTLFTSLPVTPFLNVGMIFLQKSSPAQVSSYIRDVFYSYKGHKTK